MVQRSRVEFRIFGGRTRTTRFDLLCFGIFTCFGELAKDAVSCLNTAEQESLGRFFILYLFLAIFIMHIYTQCTVSHVHHSTIYAQNSYIIVPSLCTSYSFISYSRQDGMDAGTDSGF